MVNAWFAPSSVPVGRFTFAPRDRAGHFVDPDPPACQGAGIQLNANSVLLGTVDLHLGNAAHHGDALGNDRLGVIVHCREGQVWAN